jgi:TIR domain
MSIPEAVKHWSGKLGLPVRKAALDSEINNLSPEGRRTLLAAALLHECSRTELMQLTGYDPEILSNCLEELRALFLVSAPAIIAKEARFRVQNNTRILVLESQTMLVKDPTSMQKAYERIRRGQPSVNKIGHQKSVAHAITQANAFLRNSNPEDAIETIKQVQKLLGKMDHPELLYALAKSEFARLHPDLNNVRGILKRAYDAGQRKALFFDLWYSCEIDIKHYRGAVDVASNAIDEHSADKKGWLVKRSEAKHLCAHVRGRNADIVGALEDFIGARDDIKVAMHLAHGRNDENEIIGKLYLIHEELWRLLSVNAYEVPEWIESLEVAIDAVEGSKDQLVWIERAVTCVGKILDRFIFSDKNEGAITIRQYNLVDQRISTVQAIINKLQAPTNEKEKVRVKNLSMLLLEIKNKLDSMIVNEAGTFEGNTSSLRVPTQDQQDARFDVFLAHNSSDKPFIRVISKHLQNKGVRPWLDENEIPPGRWFQDVIQDAIYKSRTAAIFIGQQGLGRWQALELKSFISQAVEQGIPVIPVLLPGVREIPAELSFLQGLHAVKFKNADDTEAIGSLIWGIRAP